MLCTPPLSPAVSSISCSGVTPLTRSALKRTVNHNSLNLSPANHSSYSTPNRSNLKQTRTQRSLNFMPTAHSPRSNSGSATNVVPASCVAQSNSGSALNSSSSVQRSPKQSDNTAVTNQGKYCNFFSSVGSRSVVLAFG